jgi:hypothetical protein
MAKAKCEARFGKGMCVTLMSSGHQPRENCEIIYPAGGSCEQSEKADDRPYSYYVGENIFCLWVPFREGNKEEEESARKRCRRCNKGQDCQLNRVPQSTPACTFDCADDPADKEESSTISSNDSHPQSSAQETAPQSSSALSDTEENPRARDHERADENQKKGSQPTPVLSDILVTRRTGESDEHFRARQQAAELEKQKRQEQALRQSACSVDRTKCIRIRDTKYNATDQTLTVTWENICREKVEAGVCYYQPYEDCSTGHGCSFAVMPAGQSLTDTFPLPKRPLYPLSRNLVIRAVRPAEVSCTPYLSNCADRHE